MAIAVVIHRKGGEDFTVDDFKIGGAVTNFLFCLGKGEADLPHGRWNIFLNLLF